MTFRIIFICICWVIFTPKSKTFSQSIKSLSVQLGYGHFTTRDYTVSPLLSQGGTFIPMFNCSSEKKGSIQLLELTYVTGKIESSTGNPSIITNGHFQCSYYRKIKPKNQDKLVIGLGSFLNLQAFSRNFAVISPNFNPTIITGAATAGQGICTYFRYSLDEKKSFELKTNFSIWAYIIRSGYSQSSPNNTNTESGYSDAIGEGIIKTFNGFTKGDLCLTYNTSLGNRTCFQISSELNWLIIPGQRDFSMASNLFLTGLKIKL